MMKRNVERNVDDITIIIWYWLIERGREQTDIERAVI